MSLSRQQLTLLAIFALFMGPVILVIMMRSAWWQYQPAGLKNRGHLVQPAVHLSLGQLPGVDKKWVILQVLEKPCGKACIDQVTTLRQIHRAAGRKQQQLAIVLLAKPAAEPGLQARLEAIYPEFHYMTDPAGTLRARLATINTGISGGTGLADGSSSYVLDPLGNVILAYTTDADPNDIHTDLKRLLKWSDQEGTR